MPRPRSRQALSWSRPRSGAPDVDALGERRAHRREAEQAAPAVQAAEQRSSAPAPAAEAVRRSTHCGLRSARCWAPRRAQPRRRGRTGASRTGCARSAGRTKAEAAEAAGQLAPWPSRRALAVREREIDLAPAEHQRPRRCASRAPTPTTELPGSPTSWPTSPMLARTARGRWRQRRPARRPRRFGARSRWPAARRRVAGEQRTIGGARRQLTQRIETLDAQIGARRARGRTGRRARPAARRVDFSRTALAAIAYD